MNLREKLLLMGIALFMPVLSFGQTTVKKHKGAVVETHGDTILIQKGERDLRINIYEDMKRGEETYCEEIFSGVYVDHINEKHNILHNVFPFIPNKKETKNFKANYPFFYLNFGRLASNAFRYSSYYPQKSGKSIDWGFNFYNSEVQLDRKGQWGLTWALGFAYSRHVFDANAALDKMEGHVVWEDAPEETDYQKSWLRYWSFRVPIAVEWQKKVKKHPLYLAAGPEIELRFAMKSKVKYDGHVHTLISSPNANVLGANLMFQAGYGCLSFIGRFGLTPLMEKDRSPQLYHNSIGFGIHF